MFYSQRMLLALVACVFSTALLAQINVDVEIRGIRGDLEKNARLFLSIEQQKGHPLMSESRLRRLHKKGEQEIARALQPFGYYRPTIDSQLKEISPDLWRAIYTVDAGSPLNIGQVNFTISGEMNKDPEFEPFIQKLPLRQGNAFNHLEYENLKVRLAKLAAERGYFNARFVEHRVAIDLDAYEAHIHLHYDGGQRYRFGEIFLEQNVLDAGLLRRYISFQQGSPYSLSKLIDLQQALNDSDYFRNVEVSPDQAQSDRNEIPITVKLSPRKRHRYTIGMGYGTDTGARAKFGWEMPRLNRRGHRSSTEVNVAQIGYTLGLRYRVPVFNPRTDQMVYSAGIVNEKTDTSDSTVSTIGMSLNRGRGLWREAISLSYQQEEYVVADDRGVSTMLMPGVNYSRTWGQRFIYILDGLRFDIALRGANRILVSDTDFIQLQSGAKAINPLGRHNRIIARGRLGGTWTEEFDRLPSSIRFFAGGTESVRGFAYQSLGPLDDNGQVVGGKYLIVGSIELEHRIKGKWSATLFYDIGNAVDKLDDDLENSVGIGTRWQSPVGPVRFDLASAISRKGAPLRLHVNIGPDL